MYIYIYYIIFIRNASVFILLLFSIHFNSKTSPRFSDFPPSSFDPSGFIASVSAPSITPSCRSFIPAQCAASQQRANNTGAQAAQRHSRTGQQPQNSLAELALRGFASSSLCSGLTASVCTLQLQVSVPPWRRPSIPAQQVSKKPAAQAHRAAAAARSIAWLFASSSLCSACTLQLQFQLFSLQGSENCIKITS